MLHPKLTRSIVCALFMQISPDLMAACEFDSRPQVTELSSKKWLYVWEQSYNAKLFESTTPDHTPLLNRYLHEVSQFTFTDPIQLLARQQSIFVKAYGERSGLAFAQLMEGRIGNIAGRRCIDALLLETHLSHQTTTIPPTEFIAVTLRKGRMMRFYQVIGRGYGAPQLPPEVLAALNEGWIFANHLHNHPFYVPRSSNHDIAGTLIPSGAVEDGGMDIGEYLRWRTELGLQSASITNGFNTLTLDASEFDKFDH